MKKIVSIFWLMLPVLFLLQPVLLNAQSNQYLHFDRVDDHVRLDEGSQYICNTDGITMAGWFYTDELAYGQGMMSFRSGDQGFYLIQLSNGVLECRFKSSTGFYEYVAPANTIVPQYWQHLAWVYDGTSCKLYVNGNLKGSTSASGQFTDPAVAFTIGKCLLGGFNFVFGGRADEVSVWNVGLTQEQIQDMIDNELTGSEDGLQMYYKFNQGDPGGDNTSITHLISEIDSPARDGVLLNFALTGETSNFNGTLDPGYQAISFPQIPNKLTTDPPFELEATATSGLPVYFEILYGPATLDGNTVTLTGDSGEVAIEATQPGDTTYNPADPIVNTFMVLDPNTHVPDIDARSPLSGDVYVPQLSQIHLATITSISYPELFSVENVKFEINGENIPAVSYYNDHYDAWWTPPAYGNYSINIISTTNFGASAVETVNINVVQEASDQEVLAVDGVWLNTDVPTMTVDAELPSYLGAFDQITATLEVECPPGGCGAWDRVAHVEAKGHNGDWFEIIRYITPYGVPCSHTIDLTDYMSVLQGKISFRVTCATLDNGYEYYLTLNYSEGTPTYPYSFVNRVWYDYYPFGDYANMQPVEIFNYSYPPDAVASKLKLVSTGHGWGNLNTGNAAEFYEASHTIWVNGEQTFDQHNWWDCNPNPDGCQPQNGTWYYNRAGWCPGAIAQWFDYDMTSFIQDDNIELQYVFYPDYVDFCHPNHPDCVTGQTCSNCNDGFNPALAVACNLVVFSNNPILGLDNPRYDEYAVTLAPNPTSGYMEASIKGKYITGNKNVEILNISGEVMDRFEWEGKSTTFDMTAFPQGLYLVRIIVNGKAEIHKIIKQ